MKIFSGYLIKNMKQKIYTAQSDKWQAMHTAELQADLSAEL